MHVRLTSLTEFAEYASVSCAFRVHAELDVDRLAADGVFDERGVIPPYVKDYDAVLRIPLHLRLRV